MLGQPLRSRFSGPTARYVAWLSLLVLAGCSQPPAWLYDPMVNQGTPLHRLEHTSLHQGMTKTQVVEALGPPSLIDPYDNNRWYYLNLDPHQPFHVRKGWSMVFGAHGRLVHAPTALPRPTPTT